MNISCYFIGSNGVTYVAFRTPRGVVMVYMVSSLLILVIGSVQLVVLKNPDGMVLAGFCAVIPPLASCAWELQKLNKNIREMDSKK